MTLQLRREFFVALAFGALVTGCSPPGTSALRAPANLAQPDANRQLAPAARKGKNLIYWGSYFENTITIFPSRGINPKPVGIITSGLSNPDALFVDKRLYLYAANIGTSTISVYKPGGTSPSLTIDKGLFSPRGITVDQNGVVYCANAGGTITEYPQGQTAPSRTLSLKVAPEYLAIDSAGNLYVSYLGAYRKSGVMEFRPGARHGKDLGLDIGSAGALEVDRSGNIIIIDAASSTIDVFAPGRTKPSKKVMVAGAAPLTLSLNKNETKLYVSVDVRSSFYSVRLLDYPNGTKLTHKLTDNLMDSPIAVSPDNVL